MVEKGKKILQRKRLSAIFASFAILIVGSISLLESMSLDYYSVLSTLGKVIPSSIAMGALGWVMGMILDRPKKRSSGFSNSYLSEAIKTSLAEENMNSSEELDI